MHEGNQIEIVGLKGGFHYDIWVEASVEGCHTADVDKESCISQSTKKTEEVGCKFRCNDGTCLNQRRNVRFVLIIV